MFRSRAAVGLQLDPRQWARFLEAIVQHVGALRLFHKIKQIAKPLEDRPLKGGRKRNQRCVAQLGTEVRQDSRNAVERAGDVGRSHN